MAVKTIVKIENTPIARHFESLIILKITVDNNIYYRVRMSNGNTDVYIEYTRTEMSSIVNDLVSSLL